MISKVTKVSLIIITLFLAFKLFIVGHFLLSKEFFSNLSSETPANFLQIPPAGSRLLLIAPHPDDEIAGCCNLISKALENNCNVKIVIMTNGDGVGIADYLKYKISNPKPEFFRQQGHKRQAETKKSLAILGVQEKDIIFLSYPDRGSLDLWKNHWDYEKPFISLYTKSNHSIYDNTFTKNAPYTGNNLADDIEKIILQYAPTHIVYPHFYDAHVDHFTANNFVKYLIAKLNLNVIEITYLVHRGNWPTPPGYFPNLPLAPPKALTTGRTKWFSLPLSTDDIKRKEQCFLQFKTQQKNILMKYYLLSFLRKNELFGVFQDKDFQINDTFLQPGNSIDIDIHNPFADTLNSFLNKPADIRDLSIDLNEKNINATISLGGPPKKNYQYLLYLIFLHKDQSINRVVLSIDNLKLKLEKFTKNTIELPAGTSYSLGKNSINISIPYKDMDNTRAIFVNTVTYHGDKLIDRTGARLIKIFSGITLTQSFHSYFEQPQHK